MKEIQKVAFANTTTKNNLDLKKRSKFMSSYKDLKLKHNLQDNKNNPNIKKMDKYKMDILKLKLQREQRTKKLNYVLGILALIAFVLFMVWI